MIAKFRGKDFLTLMDFTREEINDILNVSYEFKRKWAQKEAHEYLRGKTVAMIFEKHSTRTRTSFQAAIAHLGAQSFYMRPDEMQLARGEPIKDTARVIDRYCDALVIRTFGQDRVEEFAQYMKNPVINALSDVTHPCQALADLLTIREKKGDFKGLKLAYAGDMWNVCYSTMIAAGTMGFDIFVAIPNGYPPDQKVYQFAMKAAKRSGTKLVLTQDLNDALKDADIVYAMTWHHMGGTQKEKEQRIKDFSPYQINEKVVKVARPDFIFMHCLPGYRGEEMTDEMIEGSHSVVWDQAENRIHTQKAILSLFIG